MQGTRINWLKSFHGSIQHHVGALGIAFVAAFAIAIYAYILPLPFFRDDMVMLLWLRDMPWSKLWVDATGFPYYRPLSFSTLKLSELAFGWPEPISLHVLNLVLHAANSVMVALLTALSSRLKTWPVALRRFRQACCSRLIRSPMRSCPPPGRSFSCRQRSLGWRRHSRMRIFAPRFTLHTLRASGCGSHWHWRC